MVKLKREDYEIKQPPRDYGPIIKIEAFKEIKKIMDERNMDGLLPGNKKFFITN